ncbi:MAG: lysophospholipid acyltransferase family protein [Desulfobacterales bacterium]|nr:MAG: lysophospholipid acyltransferase family protein [Desulfobacterales bacterium]
MKRWKYAAFYIFGWVARIVAALWLCTCRVTVFGQEVEENYFKKNAGKGLLYASWHRGLIFLVYFYRNLQFVVMASASEDGELAAQATRRFGWIPVRGSSTRRGGQALREMEALVNRGHRGGLVVDAPTGPPYISKAGIVVLAKRTGLPIIPVMWSADRFWRLGSWDRTIIPKPFCRIVFLYHDALIHIPADASREEGEDYRQKLDQILNGLMYQTDHFFRTPGLVDPRQIEVPQPVPLPDEAREHRA